MVGGLSKTALERICKAAEKEFPHDPALQQVHIARKIIAAKAERAGMSYIEYIRSRQSEIARTTAK